MLAILAGLQPQWRAFTYIKTIEPDEATGEIASRYDAEKKSMGRVMQATQCWSSLSLLNFRLITFVAAQHVPSSYCSHVYFRSLSGILGREQALAVRRDYRNAGLDDQQVEMLTYAEQITRNASQITEANIQRLRGVGFTDVNIADIALAASFRGFMSRYFDAVGATVEPEFLDDDPAIREEMATGRK